MAKTKKFSGKKKTDAKKVETKTPTKTINGKVAKKRVSVKTAIKSDKEDLKVNSNKKQDLKVLRPFSVRLKRTKIDSKSNLKFDISGVQCELNDTKAQKHEFVNKDYEIKNNNLEMTYDMKASKNNTKTLLEKKSSPSSSKTKNGFSNTIADKSVLDVTESSGMQYLLRNKKLHERTNGRFQNQSPIKVKKCLVKLQKMSTMKWQTEFVNGTSIPIATRKCTVNLNKVPVRENLRKSLNPLTTKNCNKIANTDSVSSNVCLDIPVLDKVKRSNFRKLSLTKSFNILEGTNSNDTETLNAIKNLHKGTPPQKQNLPTKTGYTAIKHIANLSLKRKVREPIQNKVNKFTDPLLDPRLETTIPFNPARNSTLIELDSAKDKQQENSNGETKKMSSPKGQFSSQNFANKSDEIENLLNLLDGEEESLLNSLKITNETNFKLSDNNRDTCEETHCNISNNNNRTNKFFHHKNLQENSRAPDLAGTRRYNKRRTTKDKSDNIYDFVSQSQASDSYSAKHVDPTADVVRKLIKEGKVQVATNCRGKGKPKFKPAGRPKNKIKQTGVKKLNHLKNRRKPKKVTFVECPNVDVEEDHFDNDHLDDEQFVNLSHNMEVQSRDIFSESNVHNIENIGNDQQGTFSPLAKTVLINQANRSNCQRKFQLEMLEKVRNVISTPKNKQSVLTHTGLQVDLSPIAMPFRAENQSASPWRVNEDAHLPKTFNFSRGSGNLPSFSSDIIPSTPRKEKRKQVPKGSNQTVVTYEKSPIKSIRDPLLILSPPTNNIENMEYKTRNLNEPSKTSSFSSNDSNTENMPPTNVKLTPDVCVENKKIFDLKQLPNPRRGLKNRSPLKAINILDIVHLPPYKPNKTRNTDDIGEQEVDMSYFEKNTDDSNQEDHSNESLNIPPQNDRSKNLIQPAGEDLFGFEEYLSQSDISSQENNKFHNSENRNEQNQTIQFKLECLRKLKPHENDLQNSKYVIKNIPIFDDEGLKDCGVKQRGIKEMLCSTLLDLQPSTSKDALKRLNKDKLTDPIRSNFGQNENLSELFTDPEPETTFNESGAHRTYTRPQRRKRRLNKDNFIMLLESDASEEEDNSAEQQKHHLDQESDKSKKKVSKKKRQAEVDDIALIKFVKEFNEMCKEVESHDYLVVEKNA